MKIDFSAMATEQRNPNTMEIDTLSTLEMVKRINSEDKTVALAVERELPAIAEAIDVITGQLKKGGRLFYCGAGTSGRLGVLDASECPPTYGVSPDLVVALIAGGKEALLSAREGAEDDFSLCEADLRAHDFCKNDVLVGIAASGRTPYVLGGMRYAKACGAPVISLTCNEGSQMAAEADIAISPVVGPEVVTGSTRMKAGTAQKLVLNMLSTGVMIKRGKVYENLMVDVQPTNEKLIARTRRIVMLATGVSEEEAEAALSQCSHHPKTAIVMIKRGVDAQEAAMLLLDANGFVRKAIES